MLGAASAIGSSVSYGTADYLGGTASRRLGTLPFIFCTQLIGVALAASWVLLSADRPPALVSVAAAAAAGITLTVALGAFFQGMVVGMMSIVAPVSATGVAVPILVGLVRGERPGAVQALGMALAIFGVVLSARQPRSEVGTEAPASGAGVGLALVAAVANGLFLWLMAPASRDGVPWAVLIARVIPAVVLTAIVWARRVPVRAALARDAAPLVLGAALFGFAGISLYAYATRQSQLAIVSVLGSLYPAVTVLLAYRLLGERIGRVQQLGVVAIVAGVIALSASP